MEAISVMMVGVGGQGTLLASKIIGSVMQKNGLDVKVSEVHGMSQRGGSVVTYVRSGQKVYSPIIDQGGADCILAFEEFEAARYLSYLKKDGLLIMAEQRIDPMPVVIGRAKAPEDMVEKLKSQPIRLVTCNAPAMAEEAGSAKAVNIVLLAVFAKQMAYNRHEWEEAIAENVQAKFLPMNLAAFSLGWERS